MNYMTEIEGDMWELFFKQTLSLIAYKNITGISNNCTNSITEKGI